MLRANSAPKSDPLSCYSSDEDGHNQTFNSHPKGLDSDILYSTGETIKGVVGS
jgi:hypothetical protein